MKDIIINFCPTGMRQTKQDSPFIPISINEIIDEVGKAYELGITIVHLHARTKNQEPDYRAETYKSIIDGIKRYCPDLIICISHSGRTNLDFNKRTEAMTLKADMGSLTLSSMNFFNDTSINSPEIIQKMIEKMKNNGIIPELEVFDTGMLNYAKYLIEKKILIPPHYFNIILGNISSAQFDLNTIGLIIKELPDNSYWSIGGFGQTQLKSNTISIIMGGGVRIGLEDNLYYDKNKKYLATNLKLLKRIHYLANIFERNIMKPSKLRKEFQNVYPIQP